MIQECLPSYSSGICRIRSSSGKLICILAAKGSEQKSYQPSSAHCTNNCNVWKSLLNVSNFRHSCWVWLRLNLKHNNIISYQYQCTYLWIPISWNTSLLTSSGSYSYNCTKNSGKLCTSNCEKFSLTSTDNYKQAKSIIYYCTLIMTFYLFD